ncbi:MAG: PA14 domain-containing protein, partial [Candidatus Parabeggiatoa sp.]|nr:PA14 domain-containing protein [Candidatus Parabeggiatoa sp.]
RVKLFIDNLSVIESWDACGNCSRDDDIYFEGDKWYPIQIDFFHFKKNAEIELHWRMPGSNSIVIVPSEYFRTKNL